MKKQTFTACKKGFDCDLASSSCDMAVLLFDTYRVYILKAYICVGEAMVKVQVRSQGKCRIYLA